jgi:hypothetical protein
LATVAAVSRNDVTAALVEAVNVAPTSATEQDDDRAGAIIYVPSDMQQMEQAMAALHLDVGRQVVLNGLKSAPHLNGSQGRLLQWDAAAERWRVLLITGQEKGQEKAVKERNLLPVVTEDMLQQVGKTKGQDSFAMNTWLNLPGMSGTFVRFVAHDGQQDHLFYKFLSQHQATIEFRCYRWHPSVIRLEVTDVLVICEVKQAWPFCFLCKRFLTPPEDHRKSISHIKMMGEIANNSAAFMRDWGYSKTQKREVYTLQPDN